MARASPAADLRNLVAALRAECTEMLDFTSSLSDEERAAPSAAAGWRIADVVAHIGATARNCYAPPDWTRSAPLASNNSTKTPSTGDAAGAGRRP
ncbi:maleylpyruvate isomerase N-terminal domain-containing protein [Streptomyces hawaiiensis]|uniref:maleylpyruvate isomerase N-terminal domain-containing protein n=1 Tax=Streptomyces hawaiiensis TaxID=67305 RepID=UPI0036606854